MIKTSLEERIMKTFEHLHANPEISWEEVETTKYIKTLLEEANCKVTTFDDCTGVVGEFGNFDKDLPVVGIRADMDALWQEVDGTFQPNHSCGHDAHMTMVLGVLWKLKNNPELHDKVAIKFIFQPAEETGEGALKMVEKNVIDDVDYLFGIHLRPEEETKMGKATPVIVHGAVKMYKAEIIGDDAHGARPHLNENAIEIGAQIVNLIRQIHLDPRIPHSVKMTQFHAGGKNSNIIPGNATFSLDLRSQNNQVMEELVDNVNDILTTVRKLYKVEINITETNEIVASETDLDAIEMMRQSIEDVLGKEYVDEPLMTPGGDDFHFYTIKKPSLKATMLGLGCDLKPGLHHPNMTFNKDALIHGVNILYQALINTYGLNK